MRTDAHAQDSGAQTKMFDFGVKVSRNAKCMKKDVVSSSEWSISFEITTLIRILNVLGGSHSCYIEMDELICFYSNSARLLTHHELHNRRYISFIRN